MSTSESNSIRKGKGERTHELVWAVQLALDPCSYTSGPAQLPTHPLAESDAGFELRPNYGAELHAHVGGALGWHHPRVASDTVHWTLRDAGPGSDGQHAPITMLLARVCALSTTACEQQQ